MSIPKHVAIIPDGNRRWAKSKNIPALEGHKTAFEKTLPALLEKADQLGVEFFTFWALSTENFIKRNKMEIEGLLSLGKFFYSHKLDELKRNGVKIKFIGDINILPEDTQAIIKKTTEETKKNSNITFIIAVNYGGRDELMRAMQKVVNMNYLSKSVNKENFGQFLDTNGVPDPDLIIRTGGEMRLSGFMPWQTIYSELYFTDILFPDFNQEELEKAVTEFSNRQRRFGK